MWISLILVLTKACFHQDLFSCLREGQSMTSCALQADCVEFVLEKVVTSHQIKVVGFFIREQQRKEFESLTLCKLSQMPTCFENESMEIIDCISQNFCIEFIEVHRLQADLPQNQVASKENDGNIEMNIDKNSEKLSGQGNLDHSENIELKNGGNGDFSKENDGKSEGIDDKSKEIDDKSEEIDDESEGINDKSEGINDKSEGIDDKSKEIDDKSNENTSAIVEHNLSQQELAYRSIEQLLEKLKMTQNKEEQEDIVKELEKLNRDLVNFFKKVETNEDPNPNLNEKSISNEKIDLKEDKIDETINQSHTPITQSNENPSQEPKVSDSFTSESLQTINNPSDPPESLKKDSTNPSLNDASSSAHTSTVSSPQISDSPNLSETSNPEVENNSINSKTHLSSNSPQEVPNINSGNSDSKYQEPISKLITETHPISSFSESDAPDQQQKITQTSETSKEEKDSKVEKDKKDSEDKKFEKDSKVEKDEKDEKDSEDKKFEKDEKDKKVEKDEKDSEDKKFEKDEKDKKDSEDKKFEKNEKDSEEKKVEKDEKDEKDEDDEKDSEYEKDEKHEKDVKDEKDGKVEKAETSSVQHSENLKNEKVSDTLKSGENQTSSTHVQQLVKHEDACKDDCEVICNRQNSGPSCKFDCISEFCMVSSNSDYFKVLATGLFLFLVVFVIYLFVQNKSLRNAIENGEYGIAIYSSI
jgi:hypothetical protein